MLKFQDQDEVFDANQVRVSPQELTEALRSVDERKEAEARAQADTIPLGEAIQALGIHHTSEEIWEALQEYRARENQGRLQSAVRPRGRRTIEALTLVISLLSMGVLGIWLHGIRQDRLTMASPATVVAPALSDSVIFGLKTKPLSQVGRDELFHSDDTTLLNLAKGASEATTIVDVGAMQKDLWIAMRGASGLEIHGWTTPSEALKLANGLEAMLFRSPENFTDQGNVTAVSVPLDRLLHSDPSGNGENMIVRAVPARRR